MLASEINNNVISLCISGESARYFDIVFSTISDGQIVPIANCSLDGWSQSKLRDGTLVSDQSIVNNIAYENSGDARKFMDLCRDFDDRCINPGGGSYADWVNALAEKIFDPLGADIYVQRKGDIMGRPWIWPAVCWSRVSTRTEMVKNITMTDVLEGINNSYKTGQKVIVEDGKRYVCGLDQKTGDDLSRSIWAGVKSGTMLVSIKAVEVYSIIPKT